MMRHIMLSNYLTVGYNGYCSLIENAGIFNMSLSSFFLLKTCFFFLVNKYNYLEYGKFFLKVKFLKFKSIFFHTIGRGLMGWFEEKCTLIIKIKKNKKKKKYLFKSFLQRFLFKKNYLLYKSFIWQDPCFYLQFCVFLFQSINFLRHNSLFKKNMFVMLGCLYQKHLLFGLLFKLSGKISVGGNARTRTLKFRYGVTAKSKLWLKGVFAKDIINTITGCMGIWLWFFF